MKHMTNQEIDGKYSSPNSRNGIEETAMKGTFTKPQIFK